MAELVEIMGISHSPNFPGQIAEPNPEPAIVEAAHDYELMRQRMAGTKPDVLVMIASYHLNQFFMDNMPAFLIGKAPRAEGPFPHEMRTFGIAPYRADVEVGKAIRRIIDALPSNKRVGVLSSGHLAIEIGGPKEGRSSSDPEFDRRMMNLVGRGDVENVIEEATWDRMMASGNVTPGFLNFVLLMGLADGKAPSVSGVRFPKSKGSVPYMAWDSQPGVLP